MGDLAITNRHSSNNPQRDQNNQMSHGYPDVPANAWLHDQRPALVHTLVDCGKILRGFEINAVPLARLQFAAEDLTGFTVSFDSMFYTKNGPMTTDGPPPRVPTAWQDATYIHTKIGKRRFVMVLDPRWITTSTAFSDFRSGRTRFAGLAILKKARGLDDPIIASPIVIGGTRAQEQMMDQIFGTRPNNP